MRGWLSEHSFYDWRPASNSGVYPIAAPVAAQHGVSLHGSSDEIDPGMLKTRSLVPTTYIVGPGLKKSAYRSLYTLGYRIDRRGRLTMPRPIKPTPSIAMEIGSGTGAGSGSLISTLSILSAPPVELPEVKSTL
jgi:hypothetical protein